MSESQSSVAPPAAVFDAEGNCVQCSGTGRIRRFHIIPAVLAIVGLGGAGYVVVEYLTGRVRHPLNWRGVAILAGVGLVGLYALLDREKCDSCDGMGRRETDNDDPFEGEWDTGVDEPK